MAEDIKKIIKDTAQETAKEVEGRLGVLIEAVQSDVKHVVEAVDTHTKQIAQLQNDVGSLKKDMTQVKDDVTAVKVTLESANLLDSRQQFADLQKRVVVLESKEK